ncbi:unnamed protein product [Discula destructiva]
MEADIKDATLNDPGKECVFHRFPDLPKELRLQIWETAIPRERLIHVSLKLHQGRRYELAAAEPRYLQRNILKKPISGERYRAVVEGEKLNSKLLKVSSESRQVALAFYRVHIPVYLTGPTLTERTSLLFNPEHDFLHIEAIDPVKETLIDFLWDLKAYDPKDVGLLNLAVDLHGFCANDLQYLKRSDLFLIRQRTALVETLSQLKAVWFINLQSSKGSYKQREHIRAPDHEHGGIIPLAGSMSTFARAGPDPRSGLEDALEQLSMGEIDPREILFRWRRLLRTWEVEHTNGPVEYRVLVATTAERRRMLRKMKQNYDANSSGLLPGNHGMHGLDRPPAWFEQWRVDQAGARGVVVGFWLFPIEALGEIGEGDRLDEMNYFPGRMLDMRQYWPELVLSKQS